MSSERRIDWRSRAPLLLATAAVVLAAVRFIAVVNAGVRFDRGDFYATMPPAYSQHLNPTLWNNIDLIDSWVFKNPTYLYGPTQYLSIAPLVYFFDSYAEISRFLLVFYGAIVLASAVMLRNAMNQIEPLSRAASLLIVAATIGFFPLLQAYGQREFEVFVFAGTVAGLYFLMRRREWVAGVLFGYITWFKFLPLLWVALLAMRRWAGAVAAFVITSAVVWGAAQMFLGLENFQHLWTLAGAELAEGSRVSAICADFATPDAVRFANSNLTAAGVRFALCRFGSWYPWLPIAPIYFALAGALLAAFLVAFWRLERSALGACQDLWRRALEASVVVIMTCGFFYSHYYYLGLLAIPIAVLIARYAEAGTGWLRRGGLAAAYTLLTAFIIPPTIWSALLGFDVYRTYMQLSLYFYGEMILIALVFYEYWRLPAAAAARPA